MTNLPLSSTTSSRASEARYVPLAKIASGGMATVFVGTLRGPLGFSQLVAIKRPHEHLLEDESFRRSLLEEARVAAQIRHANVVDVRDIELVGDSIQLIMDYVEGASLGQLMAVAGRAGKRLSPGVVVRVMLDALAGLSAVHELADADGIPLGLVHRDISPQNILVGVDGVARVTDFGIAMAEYGAYTPTTQGTLKGKIGYMAPEYIRGIRPDQRIDVFAMGIVAWEALAGRRLFKGANDGDALDRLLHQEAPRLSTEVPELAGLDGVLDRALAKAPEKRFQTAESFAKALEEAARESGLIGSHADVGREVRDTVGEKLAKRMQDVRAAQAALEATVADADVHLLEYEGTTRKYEPAKQGFGAKSAEGDSKAPMHKQGPPAPTLEASVSAAPTASPGRESTRPRGLVYVMLTALGLTCVFIAVVLFSTNRSAPTAAPADSVAHVIVAPSSSADLPANPVATATVVPPLASETATPETTAATAPGAVSPVNPTKATTKPAAAASSTTKTKTRKLPPNPYGP